MRQKKEIDWVELGCLGWDIEPTGAGMDCEWQASPALRCHDDDYAHIDRESHQLLLCGCPQFIAMVMNHLLWCVYIRLGGTALRSLVRFDVPTEGTYTGCSGSAWRVMNDF